MKQQISIGIDIDGVCRDFPSQFAKFAKEFHGITLQEEDYQTWGYPNVRDEQGRKLITHIFANKKAGRYIYEDAPPITNAYTAYKKFVEHPSLEVFLVTSQKPGYEQFTENWLENNGFTDHIQTYYERNKLKAPVQMLIDDKPEHIQKYWENQRDGILIDQPYNRKAEFERAGDLLDAYNLVINKYQKYL